MPHLHDIGPPPSSDLTSSQEYRITPLEESYHEAHEAVDSDAGSISLAKPYMLSLPNEILALIMTYLSISTPLCLTENCLLQPDYDTPLDERVKRLGWVNTTHVCTRLRNIALETPRLWASVIIVEDSTRWLSDVLCRSGNRPLSLNCHNIPWPENDDSAQACAVLNEPRHLSRVKCATIINPLGWRIFARELLTQPAPWLERLFLGPEQLGRLHNTEKTQMLVLPKTLFGTESSIAPRLTNLSLMQCDFLWSSLQHFPALTVLCIERHYVAPTNEYNVQYLSQLDGEASILPTIRSGSAFDTASPLKEVVACLRALPCLKKLSLVNALPTWEYTTSDVEYYVEFPRIPLPNLRSIVLKQRSLHTVSLILDLIDAPALRSCELFYWTIARLMGPPLQDRYERLARFLSNFSSNLAGTLSTLALTFGQPDYMTTPHFGTRDITISATCLVRESLGAYRHPCLNIAVAMAIPPTRPESFPIRHACVEPVLSALPLSNLDHLTLTDSTYPSDKGLFSSVDFAFWRRVYDICGNVTSITAKGLALAPLIPLLGTRNLPSWSFTEPPPEPRMPMFPNLKTLSLSVKSLNDAAMDLGVRMCLVHSSPRWINGHDMIRSCLEVIRDSLASRNVDSEFFVNLPKLNSFSMVICEWSVGLDWEDVPRLEEMYEEMFKPVSEVVKPLELSVMQYIHCREPFQY